MSKLILKSLVIKSLVILSLTLNSGCSWDCFYIFFGLVPIGCSDGGGGGPGVDTSCYELDGVTPMHVTQAPLCCDVQNGAQLNPSCYDPATGKFLKNKPGCKAWFDSQPKITLVDAEGVPPEYCPDFDAPTVPPIAEDSGNDLDRAARDLATADFGVAEGGGIAQAKSVRRRSEAATQSSTTVDKSDEPRKIGDEITLPPLDLAGLGGGGSSGGTAGSGSSLSGLGPLGSTGGRHPIAEEEKATAANEETENATFTSTGAPARKRNSKQNLAKKFFGSGSDSTGVNTKKNELLEFGKGRSLASQASGDPEDYFSRISKLSNLFKVVERRYRAETLKWRSGL